MKAFADLYAELDATTRTGEKVQILRHYFSSAAPADAAWAVYFLIGRRPRQVVATKSLKLWAMEEAGLPEWLFQESYDAVGDFAEVVALVLPPPARSSVRPLSEWMDRLLGLRGADAAEQKAVVGSAWREMDARQRLVWNKLLGGAFRVGVSQQLVTRALGLVAGLGPASLAHRLMGTWEPSAGFYERLIHPESSDADASRPYPFCLAHPLEGPPEALGDRSSWQAEWKWDGIRSQLIRRGRETYLWSRGEELITDRYPELTPIGGRLPDGTVVDGEVLPWAVGSDAPLPFAQLQRRIGRKALTRAILAEVPVVLLAYDLLESAGEDLRGVPLEVRRSRLAEIVTRAAMPDRFRLSPLVEPPSWDGLATARAGSRDRGAEGLMLKRLGSPYHVGRVRGDWWKWKVDPFTVDAVLTAARRGSGKRASLYTDYTFSVWQGDRLVPIAQAYSGLSDEEIRQVDRFVRQHMVEKFGPVRTVEPRLVFELAFENIRRSTRHKSGVAVRFPRILRWRHDKPAAEADSIDSLHALLPEPAGPAPTRDGSTLFGGDPS